MVTVSGPYQDRRIRANGYQPVSVPRDTREGFCMAGDTFMSNFRDTYRDFHSGFQEDEARRVSNPTSSAFPYPATSRFILPAIVRPLVASSQGAAQILSGLGNQLRPEKHREEQDKWRQPGSRQRNRPARK
jgi:hypothetical protein